MKKFIAFFTLAALTLAGCKKQDLQLINPNAPTPASLTYQVGAEQFALGLWGKTLVTSTSTYNVLIHSLVAASIMGDEQFCSAGNFGWRYTQQINAITLPAPYNNVVPNIFSTTQTAQLRSLNTLSTANGTGQDVLVYEWSFAYSINGQANTLIQALSGSSVNMSATERNVLLAWAYWWKGVAYSRLGSMYLSGIINNASDGTTNSVYVGHDAIITEANSNFNKAIALISPIAAGDAIYTSTMKAIIPSFNITSITITPAMWVREMYTYQARNYMANHKVATMTATDWNAIGTLAAKGMVQGDTGFVLGMDPTSTNDLSGTQQHVYLWGSYDLFPGWTYASERWVQDFHTEPGNVDARFTKGVTALPTSQIVVNRTARGIQFGTRYVTTPIENGGYWCTDKKNGQVQFACSWEENQLMIAEVDIRTGATEAGLAIVDAVRTANGAGLQATVGHSLTTAQALEEVRRERRVALFLRGVAFYDARRLGFTTPASAGGGRPNCVTLVPTSINSALPPAAPGALYSVQSCFYDYSYADYWDVPVTELTYNAAGSGSAPVLN